MLFQKRASPQTVTPDTPPCYRMPIDISEVDSALIEKHSVARGIRQGHLEAGIVHPIFLRDINSTFRNVRDDTVMSGMSKP